MRNSHQLINIQTSNEVIIPGVPEKTVHALSDFM